MTRKIQVIINPAAGQDEPILNTLNDVFYAAGVDWDISVTMQAGDGLRFAREAVAAGVDIVAAYGGDGTQMEVAEGLQGSGVPLAILPGGTANLMAHELNVPLTLAGAAKLATQETLPIYGIDVGQVSGDFGEQLFMLRVGVGQEANKVELADRSLKDKYGLMAYSIAAIKSLTESDKATYKLTIDGRSSEVRGFTCLVDNAGNMGFRDISFAEAIDVHDGFVDLIVIRDLGFRSMYSVGASIANLQTNPHAFHHWQARELTIDTIPPQLVHADGEVIGKTPVTIRVLPQKLNVLSPLAAGELVASEAAKIDLSHVKTTEADHRIIIVKYPNRKIAEKSLVRIKQLREEDAVELVDAVLIEKNRRGKLKIEPVEGHSTKKGLIRGSAVGLLVGVLAGPALPLLLTGGAIGAVWGKLGGHKLESRLKNDLGTVLEPGEAAICSIVNHADWQLAVDRGRHTGGQVITAELTNEEYELLAKMAEEDELITAVSDQTDE